MDKPKVLYNDSIRMYFPDEKEGVIFQNNYPGTNRIMFSYYFITMKNHGMYADAIARFIVRRKTPWVRLPEYESAVRIVGRDIEICNIETDGTLDIEGAYQMTAPEDQKFLDAINQAFGTNYRYENFSGR